MTVNRTVLKILLYGVWEFANGMLFQRGRGVVRFTTPFFVLDEAKSIPITIGSQTAWEAIRNDFIEKRSRIRSRRRSVQPPRHIDEDFFLMNTLSGLISDAFCI